MLLLVKFLHADGDIVLQNEVQKRTLLLADFFLIPNAAPS